MLDEHKDKMKQAMEDKANNELIFIHDKLYGENPGFVTYQDIQRMRDEKPMVEEAYQQLLTVYALNMDPEQ